MLVPYKSIPTKAPEANPNAAIRSFFKVFRTPLRNLSASARTRSLVDATVCICSSTNGGISSNNPDADSASVLTVVEKKGKVELGLWVEWYKISTHDLYLRNKGSSSNFSSPHECFQSKSAANETRHSCCCKFPRRWHLFVFFFQSGKRSFGPLLLEFIVFFDLTSGRHRNQQQDEKNTADGTKHHDG